MRRGRAKEAPTFYLAPVGLNECCSARLFNADVADVRDCVSVFTAGVMVVDRLCIFHRNKERDGEQGEKGSE